MNVLCGENTGFSINKVDDQHIVRGVTFQASDREQSGGIIPRAVIHSLALLKMGKGLPETC